MSIYGFLGCKNNAVFQDEQGRKCEVSYYYNRDKIRISVIFRDPKAPLTESAWRYAMTSGSEKKVINLLCKEGFVRIS